MGAPVHPLAAVAVPVVLVAVMAAVAVVTVAAALVPAVASAARAVDVAVTAPPRALSVAAVATPRVVVSPSALSARNSNSRAHPLLAASLFRAVTVRQFASVRVPR